MTKIKNSKKGMAKKTLSISLAVAMLATSNVPVWAAEFTDGSEAVFTSEAEAPVEVVEEATVAEEVEAPEAQAGDNTNSDSRLVNVSLQQNGWASYVGMTGTVLDSKLEKPLENVTYQWVVANGGGYRDVTGEVVTSGTITPLDPKLAFIPGAENLGKDLYLHIFVKNAGKNNIDVYVPAGTVSKENLNNYNIDDVNNIFRLDEGAWDEDVRGFMIPYRQTEIKPGVDSISVKLQNGTVLTEKDFEISYTHAKGNFIDADSECEVVATAKNTSLYTGIVTQKYRISERYYQENDILSELVEGKTYEYTGNVILPGKSDIVLKESVRGNVLDSERVINKITAVPNYSDGISAGKTHMAALNLLDVPNYVQSSLPSDENRTALPVFYKIVKRDLNNCTAEIDAVALNGKDLATLVHNEEFAKKYVHIYGADGAELNLKLDKDYEIILPTQTPSGNGTYTVTLKSMGDNTKGYINTSLTITTHDFENCDFLDGNTVVNLKEAVPYTGETVSKDLSGLTFANKIYKADGTYHHETLEEGKDYSVKFEGVNAGANKGRLVVEGLRSYEGARRVYTFDITPAEVVDKGTHQDVNAAAKVVFDRANTKASDYAPSVTVKAHNTATPAKEFTLTEGKDYTVKYTFDTHNEIGEYITSTVTITNPNFQGAGRVFTEKTLIARKQLSNCTIEVPETYTYTGAAIIPDVIVKDGDEVLTKGVDYTVSASNNVNVGNKAVVTVKGTGDYGMNDADGIYDKDSTLTANFTITPADAKDVEVIFAGGNTGIKYTGKNLKPTIVMVTLNGNDVTQQFNISYPTTNINVGKGMVTLTPVAYDGYENFYGTKDAIFNIVARELTGNLFIYDKDGHMYRWNLNDMILRDAKGKKVSFDYDGTEHTFADVEFVPTGDYAGYVTKDDYEIKYVDNVYGGTAYIYVEGKGNFAGTETIKNAENEVINSVVDGTDVKFNIETYQFKEQHVEIGNAEYAAGQTAKPQVTVTVLGQKLVEGTDYVLEYGNRGELTNGKTEKVTVKGIKAFKGSVTGYYAVVKRDLAHTNVIVNEKSNGTYDVVVYNEGVIVPTSEYTVTDDGHAVTVTAVEGSKYYTGSQTVEFEAIEIVKPETPVIADVDVTGNRANVILSGDVDGATGYDFVISKDRYCTESKAYDDVSKNILNTETTFNYVQEGVYYAYCHAWVRDENGKKVFSDWSNGFPFVVTAITPDTPKITNIKVNGSTVTVTYTATANASGYDVVLGSEVKRIAGEKRPVNYGTLVEKNIMGDKVTATFKNVPAGTYYAGLHAFNRTAEDGKKVFSPWSLAKTVKVK